MVLKSENYMFQWAIILENSQESMIISSHPRGGWSDRGTYFHYCRDPGMSIKHTVCLRMGLERLCDPSSLKLGERVDLRAFTQPLIIDREFHCEIWTTNPAFWIKIGTEHFAHSAIQPWFRMKLLYSVYKGKAHFYLWQGSTPITSFA